MSRLIKIPDNGIIRTPIMRGGDTIGERNIDLSDFPVIDAVPVVRCRECIHYEMGVCLKIYDDGAASSYAWQERKTNDFCSYGERKEGAD